MTMIYAHGNSEDLIDSLRFARKMSGLLKIEFVIFDYSSYGDSQLTSSSESIFCRDLEVVLGWVSRWQELSNIVLYGFSLGSYPVCYCAANYNLKAIILQSPLCSLVSAISE